MFVGRSSSGLAVSQLEERRAEARGLVAPKPQLQMDPEGQVYLEAIARTVAEAGQFATLGARILNGTQYDQPSVTQAIRQVFENIASGNVEVDEEIRPYVP